jgi:hypothetical protein
VPFSKDDLLREMGAARVAAALVYIRQLLWT